MVVVNIHSGLGNQLFQYALGESLRLQGFSVKYNKGYHERSTRDFKLDVFHTILKVLNDKEQREFYIYLNPKWIILQGKYSLFYKLLRHIIYLYYRLCYKKRMVLTTLSEDYVKQVSVYQDYLILNGYWSNLRYFDHIRDRLVKQIQLKNEYLTDDFMYFRDLINASGRNSVSIHVRRGDYLKSARTFNQLGFDYYNMAARYIEKEVGECRYFLFSDDIEWCKERFVAFEHITYISGSNLRDYHDFCLMKECHHNIIANSTFSWWAAYLNEHHDKIVVAPKKWYNDLNRQTQYDSGYALPHQGSWIKM